MDKQILLLKCAALWNVIVDVLYFFNLCNVFGEDLNVKSMLLSAFNARAAFGNDRES